MRRFLTPLERAADNGQRGCALFCQAIGPCLRLALAKRAQARIPLVAPAAGGLTVPNQIELRHSGRGHKNICALALLRRRNIADTTDKLPLASYA